MARTSAGAVAIALSALGMVGAATFAVSQGEEGGVVEEASPESAEGADAPDGAGAGAPGGDAAPAATGGADATGTTDAGAAEADAALAEAEAEIAGSPLGNFFTELTAESVAQKAADAYAADVRFEDPFGRYEGRDAAVEHLKKVLAGARSAQFEIKEEFVSGDETVALWTLKLEHEDLNDGDAITVDGVTHYRSAGGKIAYQRDHYDLGAVVYENVWLLGAIVKWVKGKGV